jgi:hypothetical protein
MLADEKFIKNYIEAIQQKRFNEKETSDIDKHILKCNLN